MHLPIAITSIASISPLGHSYQNLWEQYCDDSHCFEMHDFGPNQAFAAFMPESSRLEIQNLRDSDHKYKFLDKSVLYGIYASRMAVKNAGWRSGDNFGINIGSSRGATDLFEKHHSEFLKAGKVNTLASPVTTLGNISSWVSHDLQSDGPEISHSITCSTALHAMLNGIAWLKAGMAEKFLVGGSEAPLTDFTIAQMKALKIYAYQEQEYPCQALNMEKEKNTMILGEGASVCCLEMGERENALGYIAGIGYATELLEHNISISADALCFQKSMAMALKNCDLSEVDAIVMHAPGTRVGDLSEMKAIEKVFGDNLPLLTSNKWKIGHTFGASGMLSVELALLMMREQSFVGVPFTNRNSQKAKIRKVLVNAVGFGGNAVSILLSISAKA
ncbi:MAG: beta-ketoacyl synthase N-terminal-like domain-containing protein [Flavobacterium sp.]